MIELKGITKIYKDKKASHLKILDNVSLKINRGDYVVITGKSGAGKSTLLNILGGLDVASSGDYIFNDEVINKNSKTLEKFRYNNIGIIVQNYALINHKNIFDNISLPLKYKKYTKTSIIEKVNKIAKSLDIMDKLRCFPKQLSGGQCQRVAIARALCKNSSIILADEPTGALDNENKDLVLKILDELNKQGITIILATHDKSIYENAKKRINIDNGKISIYCSSSKL